MTFSFVPREGSDSSCLVLWRSKALSAWRLVGHTAEGWHPRTTDTDWQLCFRTINATEDSRHLGYGAVHIGMEYSLSYPKRDVTGFSEALLHVYQCAFRNIPENWDLYNNCSDNLISQCCVRTNIIYFTHGNSINVSNEIYWIIKQYYNRNKYEPSKAKIKRKNAIKP